MHRPARPAISGALPRVTAPFVDVEFALHFQHHRWDEPTPILAIQAPLFGHVRLRIRIHGFASIDSRTRFGQYRLGMRTSANSPAGHANTEASSGSSRSVDSGDGSAGRTRHRIGASPAGHDAQSVTRGRPERPTGEEPASSRQAVVASPAGSVRAPASRGDTGTVDHSPAQPSRPDPWLQQLSGSRAATKFGELQAARAPLRSPLADPQTRRIGELLGQLHAYLMSPASTRSGFAQRSHDLDHALQSTQGLPDQAVVIAYADLQVQHTASELRWPRPEIEASVLDWAARPA